MVKKQEEVTLRDILDRLKRLEQELKNLAQAQGYIHTYPNAGGRWVKVEKEDRNNYRF